MQNVLFFGAIGFYKRDYFRFGLEKLSKKYNIYFIDLTNLFNKKFFIKEHSRFYKTKKLLKVNSFKEFKKILIKKKFVCAFDLSSQNNNLNMFRKAINENNIKLVNYQTTLVPEFKRNIILKIKFFLRILLNNKELVFYYIKKLFNFNRVNKNNKISFLYDYYFCGGIKGYFNKDKMHRGTKIVYGNSLDYETFLDEKKSRIISNERFLLFVDQYLPYHNGYKNRNIPPFVSAKKYYDSLNRFFKFLEYKLDAKVVISAHPRSNLKVNKVKFKNRKIIDYTQTQRFISKSLAVINYTSTAMGFAVIHKKPIIFYTTDEINNSHDAYHVKFLSNHLGSALTNVDDTFSYERNFDKLLLVNEKKYKKYFNNYICHLKSKKETNFKKIIKILKKNNR